VLLAERTEALTSIVQAEVYCKSAFMKLAAKREKTEAKAIRRICFIGIAPLLYP
jgi:hypothetical protein